MAAAIYPSFFFTVVLLFITLYFLLGGLPLLVLKHDVPLDARFIRRFFEVYYKAAFWASACACASFALWLRPGFAIGAAALAGVAKFVQGLLVPAMQRLGERIETSDAVAITHFRRVHVAALMVNVCQLVVLVWGTLQLSKALS